MTRYVVLNKLWKVDIKTDKLQIKSKTRTYTFSPQGIYVSKLSNRIYTADFDGFIRQLFNIVETSNVINVLGVGQVTESKLPKLRIIYDNKFEFAIDGEIKSLRLLDNESNPFAEVLLSHPNRIDIRHTTVNKDLIIRLSHYITPDYSRAVWQLFNAIGSFLISEAVKYKSMQGINFKENQRILKVFGADRVLRASFENMFWTFRRKDPDERKWQLADFLKYLYNLCMSARKIDTLKLQHGPGIKVEFSGNAFGQDVQISIYDFDTGEIWDKAKIYLYRLRLTIIFTKGVMQIGKGDGRQLTLLLDEQDMTEVNKFITRIKQCAFALLV